MKLDQTAMNTVAILLEVVVVIIVFAALHWVVARAVRLLGSSGGGRFEQAATVLRQNLKLLTVLGMTLGSLAIAAVNGFLIYRGEYLPTYTRKVLTEIPRDFWVWLALAGAQVIGIAILAALVLRLVRRALAAACEWAKQADGVKANDESTELLFGALEQMVVRATWLGVLVAATRLFLLPESIQAGSLVLLKIYLIISVGFLFWRGLDAIIESLDALSQKYSSPDNILRYYDRLTGLVPLFRRSVELIIYVVVATLVVLQVEFLAPLAEWGPRAIRIIGVVFLARVVIELIKLVIEEMLVVRATLDGQELRSRKTMVPLVIGALRYLIYFGAGVVVLKELGINPVPILAGAGIIGLAVGLGAQNFINDLVSGFAILFENVFLIGDYIKIGDTEGVVEEIDLDTTRIRDLDGRLHIIRNGQIDNVINYSKSYTFAVVEVGVAYESDLDSVRTALESVGPLIKAQNDDVLEPTKVCGLEAFGGSELTYRTTTRVKPGRHRQVERELRELIKRAFDERGIEIPYAKRVIYTREETPEVTEPDR